MIFSPYLDVIERLQLSHIVPRSREVCVLCRVTFVTVSVDKFVTARWWQLPALRERDLRSPADLQP